MLKSNDREERLLRTIAGCDSDHMRKQEKLPLSGAKFLLNKFRVAEMRRQRFAGDFLLPIASFPLFLFRLRQGRGQLLGSGLASKQTDGFCSRYCPTQKQFSTTKKGSSEEL